MEQVNTAIKYFGNILLIVDHFSGNSLKTDLMTFSKPNYFLYSEKFPQTLQYESKKVISWLSSHLNYYKYVGQLHRWCVECSLWSGPNVHLKVPNQEPTRRQTDFYLVKELW